MLRVIRSSIRQALSGRGFLLSLCGTAAIIFLSSIKGIVTAFRSETLLAFGYHHSFIASALGSDGMTLALPLLSALPFTAAFLDDLKSGFLKEYLPRTTVTGYIIGRTLGCLLSGAFALCLGVFLAYGIAALLFLPLETAPTDPAEMGKLMRGLLETLALMACSGALWSSIGLLLGTITGSKYMAYASPFVLYYVLIILHERYLPDLFILYPKEWIAPSAHWQFGVTGVLLLVGELTVLAALGFFVAAGRRLRQL